jgi:predicted ArsR family transcriptional regulator
MFATGFKDLVKPQWVAVIETLKLSGGLPVSELARRIEASYMATKQYCEDLNKIGYLERSRVPRKEVGRPEIFYRLSAKADVIFPQAGVGMTLGFLQQIKSLFGESAPERVLFQHFQQLMESWLPKLSKAKSLVEKATLLANLREKEGCFGICKYDPENGFRIEQYHHPMQRIFDCYPKAVMMEQRMIEQLLGTRVTRREIPGGRAGPARVDFEIATLGAG